MLSTNKDTGINYNDYKVSHIELFQHSLVGLVYFGGLGMIFYRHLGLTLLAMLGVVFYLGEQKRLKIAMRKRSLRDQFKEAIYALSSSLVSGRSLEQAFYLSLKDLKVLYDDRTDIVLEWDRIVHRISNNEMVETILIDFADRADLEDIHNFVNVFVIAKRSGGDLVRVIKDLSKTINEKVEIQKEIDILVTQKKYEQKLLSFIVPGMVLFFSMTSPDFLSPLYESFFGRMVMTLALFLYILSDRIGKRIVEIEV